ncbi:hypothetical protein EON82_21770 [bacterium]|nr:MAG: hypothetical protein EON82_21770 [bacterium]
MRTPDVEWSVTYSDRETIHAWRTALDNSSRQAGLSDPGLGEKRPLGEGLVRFGLRDHRKVVLPLYEESLVRERWGDEVATLYGLAMDGLLRSAADAPPAADR